MYGEIDWAGNRLDGELLWVFSMALTQNLEKMMLSFCQPPVDRVAWCGSHITSDVHQLPARGPRRCQLSCDELHRS